MEMMWAKETVVGKPGKYLVRMCLFSTLPTEDRMYQVLHKKAILIFSEMFL